MVHAPNLKGQFTEFTCLKYFNKEKFQKGKNSSLNHFFKLAKHALLYDNITEFA